MVAESFIHSTFQMDSFGLIPDISPGEVSVVTSVIALLAVLQAVGKHLDSFKQAALSSDRHLLVAFFDGVGAFTKEGFRLPKELQVEIRVVRRNSECCLRIWGQHCKMKLLDEPGYP